MLAKRIFDCAVILLTAPLTLPLLLATALVVRAGLGSPVLFVQQRPGRNGHPFALIKFRTMRDMRRDDGTLLPDAQRLSRLGRALRASSLDELPELWNVLRGEMSLVGPRPLLTDYLPLYSREQARRHEVLPGITGWAQINGRNMLSWEQKFALDIWYVNNRTLALDCRILLQTVINVLRSSGISASGEATMARFEGARSPNTAAHRQALDPEEHS